MPVYELGAFADRRPYFAMKLVKGRTLVDACWPNANRPAHDLPRFLSIFEAICQTVAYAHARGVIHRDLKPSNVMVGQLRRGPGDGLGPGQGPAAKMVVADEPLARPASGETVVATVRSGSDADRVAGRQRDGHAGLHGARAGRRRASTGSTIAGDVFGLGAILCEILTGQPAYTGRSVGETLSRKAIAGRDWPTPWPGWTPAGPTPS